MFYAWNLLAWPIQQFVWLVKDVTACYLGLSVTDVNNEVTVVKVIFPVDAIWVALCGCPVAALDIWATNPPMPTQKAMMRPATSPVKAPYRKSKQTAFSLWHCLLFNAQIFSEYLQRYWPKGKIFQDRRDPAKDLLPSQRYWELPWNKKFVAHFI